MRKLQVGNKQISAHRCVIAQHSDVFRSMFEQKCTLEAQCGVVDITDARPETVMATTFISTMRLAVSAKHTKLH